MSPEIFWQAWQAPFVPAELELGWESDVPPMLGGVYSRAWREIRELAPAALRRLLEAIMPVRHANTNWNDEGIEASTELLCAAALLAVPKDCFDAIELETEQIAERVADPVPLWGWHYSEADGRAYIDENYSARAARDRARNAGCPSLLPRGDSAAEQLMMSATWHFCRSRELRREAYGQNLPRRLRCQRDALCTMEESHRAVGYRQLAALAGAIPAFWSCMKDPRPPVPAPCMMDQSPWNAAA